MYWRISGDPTVVGFARARIFDLVEDTTTGIRYLKTGSAGTQYRRAADILNFVLSHTHSISDVIGLLAALNAKENSNEKGAPGGYCDLNAQSLVPIPRLGLAPEVQTATGVWERWYIAGQVGTVALATGAPTANIIRALPILRPHGCIIAKASIGVTSGAGNARVGVYSSISGDNLWPGDLLFDSGSIDVSALGIKTVTPNLTIPRGTFAWITLVTDAATTMRTLPVAGAAPIFGTDTAFSVAPGVGASAPLTFGPLPSTFPTVGGAVLSAAPLPAIALQYSA